MGNQKVKWTAEEEEALKAGVVKHGLGKWKNILRDPQFAPYLSNRSNIDLKDKWRNMCISHGQCSRKKSKASRGKTISPVALSTLTTGNLVAEADAVDDISRSPRDVRDAPGYKAMIFEALSSIRSSIRDSNGSNIDDIMGFIEKRHEVPQNIRRILSTRLRRLVLQGKLEKVQDRYKIKDAALGTKTPMPKQKDISAETAEGAAMTAAYKIVDAEYKSFVAAEAVKEAERVSKMAEDADSLLLLANEIFEKCSRGETVRLAKSSYNFD